MFSQWKRKLAFLRPWAPVADPVDDRDLSLVAMVNELPLVEQRRLSSRRH